MEGTERFFIYELLDGALVRSLIPGSLWPVALPGYYLALLGLVLLSIRVFFRLNRLRVRKTAATRQGLPDIVPAL